MWASRILGWPAHGLAALLKAHFGVHLNKKYQRANWGIRPLPPEQLNYARLDTHYLLPLYQIQARELEATTAGPRPATASRSCCRPAGSPKAFDPDGFWRLPGARDLDDEGRGVLRELYLFREARAEAENRPPFKVLSNKALLGLSEQRPQQLRGRCTTSRAYPTGWSASMAGACCPPSGAGSSSPCPGSDRPRSNQWPSTGPNGRPSAACQARYEALRAWRNATAEARGRRARHRADQPDPVGRRRAQSPPARRPDARWPAGSAGRWMNSAPICCT